MKELMLFLCGAFAGALSIFMLIYGWSAWPAERSARLRSPHSGRKPSDASWLR